MLTNTISSPRTKQEASQVESRVGSPLVGRLRQRPGFCGPGHYLHNLKCSGEGCDRTFVHNLKEERRMGSGKTSEPTTDKPVHCCVNMETGPSACRKHVCRHALCNPCWSKGVLEDEPDSAKRSRSKGRRAGRVAVTYAES